MRVIDRPMASCYGRVALRRHTVTGTPNGFPYPPAKDAALRSQAPSLSLVGLCAAVATVCACGPVEYINQVGNRAASAVSAAKLAQSDRYAPYEYTAAEAYLHKAREEAGHAEYEDAIEYGRKAEELANRARAITVDRLAKEPALTPAYQPKSQNEEPPAPSGEPGADTTPPAPAPGAITP